MNIPRKWTTPILGAILPLLLCVLAPLTHASFQDIDQSSEFYQSASYFQEQGVVEGYADGNFSPEKNINRAEFVKIILEAKGDIDIRYDDAYSFPDVPKDAWFAKYVSTAKRLNIVQGYPDGNFSPDRTINYPESIKVILETYGVEKAKEALPAELTQFKDQWFAPYMNTAYQKNIFRAEKSFTPGNFISRGIALESLYRTVVITEQGVVMYNQPSMSFSSTNGLITTPLRAPYTVSMSVKGKIEKVKVKLYRVPKVETYLETRGGAAEDRWSNYGMDEYFAEDLVKQMELVKEFEAPLIYDKKAEGTEYGYDYFQRASLEMPVTDGGLYAVEISAPYVATARLFLLPTNQSLLARKAQGNTLYWMVNSATSEPVMDGMLTFYSVSKDKKVEVVKNGATGRDGVYLTKGTAEYVVAKNGKELALLYMPDYQYDVETVEQSRTFFSFTDRPIYRPGDKVSFKAIVREGKNGSYTVPEGEEVTMKLVNYAQGQENIILEKKYTLNAFGSLGDTFTLSQSVPTGMVSMMLVKGEHTYYGNGFQVEAYKKDEYSITTMLDKEEYVRGDEVVATMEAKYFFGEPVANQKLTYKVYKNSFYYPFWEGEMGIMRDAKMIMPPYYGSSDPVLKGTGEFDAQGKFVLKFTPGVDDEEEDYQSEPFYETMSYRVEVESVDSSNIPVRSQQNFLVYQAEFMIGAKDLVRFPKEGEEHKIEIATKTNGGKVFGKQKLNLKMKRTVYERIQEGEYYSPYHNAYIPNYRWEDYTEDVLAKDVVTNDQGVYTLTFVPDKAAYYELVVSGTDSRGNEKKIGHSFQVNGGTKYFSSMWSYEYLSMELDKDEYKEGETAKILMNTGVENKNLLILYAKDDILGYEVMQMKGTSYEKLLKLTSTHTPGLKVMADTIQDGTFISGEVTLRVRPVQKELKITVVPKKTEVLPGEETSFTVEVKDANGKPVEGEFTFTLVDKAIFELADPVWNGIFDHFYGLPYYHYTERFSTAYTTPQQQYYYRGMVDDMMTGAVAEEAMDADEAGAAAPTANASKSAERENLNLENQVRDEFLDTAIFLSGTTNAEGKAEVKVTLPDNLTTWVGVAVVHTKSTQVGVGEKSVIAKKEVVLSPHLPRFVTIKDKVMVQATVRNYMDKAGTFDVTLAMKGGKLLTNTLKQTVTLAKGESKTVSWSVGVLSPEENKSFNDTLELTLSAKDQASTKMDTVVKTLPIQLLGEEQIVSHTGEGTLNVTLKALSGKNENIRSIKLALTPTLADNLIRSIEFLTGYPYGCVEQTMSRFLPNVIVARYKNELNFKNTSTLTDLDGKVKMGLTRLYDFQHSDGGWGWWKDDATSVKNSAYVVYGLLQAKSAGYAVDKTILDKGIGYVETTMKAIANGTYSGESLYWENGGKDYWKKYMPYLFSVLALADKDMSKELETLDLTTLGAADLSYAILGYAELGYTSDAMMLTKELEKRITVNGDRAHVEEKTVDYERMYSTTLSTALALEAMSTTDPNNALVEKMIKWLDTTRQGYVYHETHATTHSIIAIVTYMRNTALTDAVTEYDVTLNGKSLFSGTLSEMKDMGINVSDLIAGDNALTIKKTGNGKLYYTLVQREFVEQEKIAAKKNGISVERTYIDKYGKALTGAVKAGDMVRVSLKVTADDDYSYVFIKDNLPAGFEPINSALKTQQGMEEGKFMGEWWDQRDLLDDHTALFRTQLSEGTHEFSYYVRAVTPGTFKVNPANVELMYMPEVNGMSESTVVEVK